MTEEFLIYGFAIGSAGCAAVAAYPLVARVWTRVAGGIEQYQQGQVERAAKELDELFMDVQPRWLKIAYGVGPLSAGLLAFVISNNVWFALLGIAVGALFPDFWVKRTRATRKQRFEAQLVDALFILSSSLRAGLSMTQALSLIHI